MELINFLTSAEDICIDPETVKIFIFIGKIVTILKIIVPIILVIIGSVDLIKAVMAQKDDEIKKAYSTLLKRVIIGVVIFFLPGLVKMVINLADNNDKSNSKCWTKVFGYNEVINKSTNLEIPKALNI